MNSDASVPPDVVFVPLPSATAAGSVAESAKPAAADLLANDPPPVAPAEPDAADCCGEGCIRCVYDVYDTKVERYKAALEQWNARHS
ncbi:MAG: oxidoreductase-like domain-containing protein [Rhodanobacter sp.]